MGNLKDRAEAGVGQITGKWVGEDLPANLKALMATELVFQTLFGDNGERIFVNTLPAYTEGITPLLEMRWASEVSTGSDLEQTGYLNMRLLFPTKLRGAFDLQRKIAMALVRWFRRPLRTLFDPDQNGVFPNPGLIKVGENIQINYDRLFVYDGLQLPAIELRVDFLFDMAKFRVESPSMDLTAKLDEQLLGDVEAYRLLIKNEEGTELIPENDLNLVP